MLCTDSLRAVDASREFGLENLPAFLHDSTAEEGCRIPLQVFPGKCLALLAPIRDCPDVPSFNLRVQFQVQLRAT